MCVMRCDTLVCAVTWLLLLLRRRRQLLAVAAAAGWLAAAALVLVLRPILSCQRSGQLLRQGGWSRGHRLQLVSGKVPLFWPLAHSCCCSQSLRG
jgi:hypothetical protein